MNDIETTIQKLQAEDGDVIVLTTQRSLPMEMIERLYAQLSAFIASLDIDAKVLVLDQGFDLKVIRTSQLARLTDGAMVHEALRTD